MSKIRPQDCAIVTKLQRGEIIPVFFIVNGHILFKGKMPADKKDDVLQYVYDKIFENCPLTWAEFCKVKIS